MAGTRYAKKDSKTLIIIVLLVILSFTYYMILKTQIKKNREMSTTITSKFNKEYQITLNIYTKMAETIFDLAINREKILSTFYDGITATDEKTKDKYRKILYNDMKEDYFEIGDYNFKQLQFHTKNHISFLRMHSPDRYGDDLTSMRGSIEYTNREEESRWGFEVGKIYSGYRFLFPIDYNNEHIGSVEIIASIDMILKHLTQKTKIPVEVLTRKDTINPKLLDSEEIKYKAWGIDDNYIKHNDDSTIMKLKLSEKNKKELNTLLESSRVNNIPETLAISSNNILVTIIPIKNFNGEVTSFILFYKDYYELKFHRKNMIILTIIFLLFFLAILLFGYYYTVSHNKIIKLLHFDFLTNTYMRRILFERMDIEVTRSFRYNSPFSIIMLDIDHFKQINDTFGHKTGDIVLKDLSYIIKENTREPDSVGRYGGEEFVVLLPETKLTEALKVAEKIRANIENTEFKSVKKVTVSAGVEEFSNKICQNSLELLSLADKKLYMAKESGRNKVV